MVPLDAESIGLAYVIATLSATYVAGLTGSVATSLGLPSPAKRDRPIAVTWQGDMKIGVPYPSLRSAVIKDRLPKAPPDAPNWVGR